jgi:AraC family transcriptional regulator
VDPIAKAVWFIESHFAGDVALDDIAAVAGISRFHLSRAFAATIGVPVMRYVRGRRLTEAARSLIEGAPEILQVALASGYGSHEAFTRAFRDQFGCTPEQIRAQGSLGSLALVEATRMDDLSNLKLEPPRFETGKAMLIAGLSQRYVCEDKAGIPSQWQRFGAHIGNLPGQVGNVAYGVASNFDDSGNFDYLTGVEVSDFSEVPAEFTRLRLAPQKYAVFQHREHVSTIASTMAAIWRKWRPESGCEPADAPNFERYGASFDPRRGTGGFEIWIPVKG